MLKTETQNSRWLSLLLLALGLWTVAEVQAREVVLLNASYDPTRAFYKEYNKAFAAYWKAQTGDDVVVKQSHGGSGKQARSVIEGLRADVVTLALAIDIDMLYKKQALLDSAWASELPTGSVPFTSTIVFLVRKGNPQRILDWSDLVRPGVQVITPNPKTSGGARWNYLAAWAYGLQASQGKEEGARQFVRKLYANVPVLDAGARGSSTTFVQRGIGDVLVTWENEAWLAIQEFGADSYEMVVPSVSVRAEPPVAVVDRVVDKKGTRKEAEAYLAYLYSPTGQRIAARHHYRPSDQSVAAEFARAFPQVHMLTLRDLGGTWSVIQKKHFRDGGEFDAIYQL